MLGDAPRYASPTETKKKKEEKTQKEFTLDTQLRSYAKDEKALDLPKWNPNKNYQSTKVFVHSPVRMGKQFSPIRASK